MGKAQRRTRHARISQASRVKDPQIGQRVVVGGQTVKLLSRMNTLGDWKINRVINGRNFCNESEMTGAPIYCNTPTWKKYKL